MPHMRLIVGAIGSCAFLLGACEQAAQTTNIAAVSEDQDANAHDHAPDKSSVIRTVKPGAEISFSHALRSPAQVGARASLDLVIEDNYTEGRMQLVAYADDDRLTIFGPSSEAVRDMRGDRKSEWSVLFTPNEDGIHYINIQATIMEGGKPKAARAYAARIEVGDITEDLIEAELDVGIQVRPDGRRIKVLPAEEPRDN